MRTPFVLLIITTIFLAALVGYANWPTEAIPPLEPIALVPVKKTMQPFRSDRELANYLRELAKHQRERQEDMKVQSNIAGIAADSAAPQATTVAKSKAEESITNTQQAGWTRAGSSNSTATTW